MKMDDFDEGAVAEYVLGSSGRWLACGGDCSGAHDGAIMLLSLSYLAQEPGGVMSNGK